MPRFIRSLLILIILLLILGALFWFFCIYQTTLPENVYVSAGNFLFEHGNYDLSATMYSNAALLTPENSSYSVAASTAYLNAGNYSKAEYYLAYAISNHPEELDLYLSLSKVYVAQDKLYDADLLISNCKNSSIKTSLEGLRPDPPTINPGTNYYWDTVNCSLSYANGIAYCTSDGQYPSTSSEPYSSEFEISYGVTTVQAIVIGSNGLVSKLSKETFTVCGVIEPVTFDDAKLDSVVRSAIGKSRHETIISSELWEITELEVPETVNDLSFLKYFINLNSLTLVSEPVDYEPISRLARLTYLDVSGISLNEQAIEAISSVSTLTDLNISQCGLQSIDFLVHLPNLSSLNAAGNSITDISVLSALGNLTELYLEENSISSIAPLTASVSLRVLSISNNPIGSIGALSTNSVLEKLYASSCSISDVSPLENKIILKELNLSENSIYSVSALAECYQLEKVNLSNNRIVDIQAVASISSLQYLNASGNRIENCPTFAESNSIVELDLSNNELSDVKGLTNLSKLYLLNISNNHVGDISMLADLPTLVKVDATENPIPDITALTDRSILVFYTPGYEGTEIVIKTEDSEEDAEDDSEKTSDATDSESKQTEE